MNKSFLTLLITTLFALTTTAQTNLYSKYMNQGKNFYNKSQFLTALERFDLAYEFAKTDNEKGESKNWKNKSRKKIKKQQADLKKALAKAEQMQIKFETAMFDKAVKKKFKTWKGYAKTDYGIRKEILSEIDSLDLSDNALLRLPLEVESCRNLKYLNLSNNPNIDWQDCYKILTRFDDLEELNLSRNNFHSFPMGVEQFSKLKILDLSYNLISSIPPRIKLLKSLYHFNISFNKLEKIPKQVNGLVNLEEFNIVGNDISNTDILSNSLKKVTYSLHIKSELDDNDLKIESGILKGSNQIKSLSSPNHSGKRDSTLAIILHYTAASYRSTVKALTSRNVKASVHFIVDRDGSITQLVNTDTIAWHAGKSVFKDLSGFNKYSIGIENVNSGVLTQSGAVYKSWFGASYERSDVIRTAHRYQSQLKFWHTYTQEQIDATYMLCVAILKEYPSIKYILGNEEIARKRKTDPGPAFPIDNLRDKLKLPFNSY